VNGSLNPPHLTVGFAPRREDAHWFLAEKAAVR
jgi:hypothetical protein